MNVLLGKEHGQAFLLEFENGRCHLLDDHRSDAFGRLIEHHQQRVAHQGARHGKHLLLAARHVRAAALAHFREIGKEPNSFSGVHVGVGRLSE